MNSYCSEGRCICIPPLTLFHKQCVLRSAAPPLQSDPTAIVNVGEETFHTATACEDNEDCPENLLCLERRCECPPEKIQISGNQCIEAGESNLLALNDFYINDEKTDAANDEHSEPSDDEHVHETETAEYKAQQPQPFPSEESEGTSTFERIFPLLGLIRSISSRHGSNKSKNESIIPIEKQLNNTNKVQVNKTEISEQFVKERLAEKKIFHPTNADKFFALVPNYLLKIEHGEPSERTPPSSKKPMLKRSMGEFLVYRQRRESRVKTLSSPPTAGIRHINESCHPGDICMNGTSCSSTEGVCKCPHGFRLEVGKSCFLDIAVPLYALIIN